MLFRSRNFTAGKPNIEGFLEDYAHLIAAYIALFGATSDPKWIMDAQQLMDYTIANFLDDQAGFFRFNAMTDQPFLAPQFEIEDNVIPAANSVMGHNLWKLSLVFEHENHHAIALKMLSNIVPKIDYAGGYSNRLLLYLNLDSSQKEIAIVGQNARREALDLFAQYVPNCIIFSSETVLDLPFFSNRFVPNKTLFYICQNKTCGLPLDHIALLKL